VVKIVEQVWQCSAVAVSLVVLVLAVVIAVQHSISYQITDTLLVMAVMTSVRVLLAVVSANSHNRWNAGNPAADDKQHVHTCVHAENHQLLAYAAADTTLHHICNHYTTPCTALRDAYGP
jgi:hypothetical protein